jgi:hypothetical protein
MSDEDSTGSGSASVSDAFEEGEGFDEDDWLAQAAFDASERMRKDNLVDLEHYGQ